MELTLPQVARLLDVTETTVTRWVQQDNLPVHEVNSQYRFDRAELLEWAAIRNIEFSPTIFQQIDGDQVAPISMADAIDRGGVGMLVPGKDRREIFFNAISGLPLPDSFDRDNLIELLLAREKMGGTAVGHGIGIPHPRYPVVLPGARSTIRICYLEQPMPIHAPNSPSIHTLFFMICPTVHEHLQLLARLASILRRDDFRKLLRDRPDKTRLIAAVRAEEHSLGERAEDEKG